MIPHDHIRPTAQLLSPTLVGRIVDEAFEVLASSGVLVENVTARRLLLEGGATETPAGRILISRTLVEQSLTITPRAFNLWDVPATHSFRIGGDEVHFDPGSAALGGINVVSGGGMMDYENCISLEKLIIDHEIIRMVYRLIDGITPRDEPMARELFADILRGEEFMSHPHTVQWLRAEHWYPRIIDRGGADEWIEAGKPSLADRAALERQRLLAGPPEPILPPEILAEFSAIMKRHSAAYGMQPESISQHARQN